MFPILLNFKIINLCSELTIPNSMDKTLINENLLYKSAPLICKKAAIFKPEHNPRFTL